MLIILSLHILSLFGNHAFYLSTCQIQVHESRNWEATIRIFQDDLQDALVQQSGSRLSLMGDLAVHAETLEEYLHSHLLLSTSDATIPYQISTAKQVNDVVEIKITSMKKWPDTPCNISCTILMELFDSQKNAITIAFMDQRKTLMFTKRQQRYENLNF